MSYAQSRIADIVHYKDAALLPQMTIKEAVAMFESGELQELLGAEA